MATPIAPAADQSGAVGLDLTNEPGVTDLTGAMALEGDGLSGATSVGDVNGDGLEDFTVIGTDSAYMNSQKSFAQLIMWKWNISLPTWPPKA